MAVSSSLGVFNQGLWAGTGDVDECWIIATYWPLVSTGVLLRSQLPSIASFRAAAGRPDRSGPTGGNNFIIMKALEKLVPKADARFFIGRAKDFTKQLKLGYVASLSVSSAHLPKYLQFGFKGSHQVSIYYKNGNYFVMNPLAKEGSALLQISLKDLQKAAGALFADGKFHAVLIRAGAGANPGAKPSKPKPIKMLPRDFNYQVVVRNYLDPWAAGDMYQKRHKPSPISIDGTTLKR